MIEILGGIGGGALAYGILKLVFDFMLRSKTNGRMEPSVASLTRIEERGTIIMSALKEVVEGQHVEREMLHTQALTLEQTGLAIKKVLENQGEIWKEIREERGRQRGREEAR